MMKTLKTPFLSFALLVIACAGYAQGNFTGQNMNFNVKTKILVSGITLESQLSSMTSSQYIQVSNYYDDGGKIIQNIAVRNSPGGKDVVQLQTYDAFGRKAVQYLPMTHSTATDGRYKSGLLTSGSGYAGSAHALFYSSGNGIPVDAVPYSTTYFETSPASRVIEQSGVGADWQKNVDPLESHTSTTSFGTNTTNEVRKWTVTGDGMNSSITGGYYPAGMLTKTTSNAVQAEGPNAHDTEYSTIIEYADNLGRVVMRKSKVDASNWAETHYVYDIYGQLRFVLTPELIKAIVGQSTPTLGSTPSGYTLLTTNTTISSNNSSKYVYASNVTTTISGTVTLSNGFHIMPQAGGGSSTLIADMAYQILYDNNGRKIAERAPGADWAFYVYDKRSRLALSQDGNQRIGNRWSFTKYDNLNRPVLSGETVISGNRDDVSAALLADADVYEARGGSYHGYTNNTYPSVTNVDEYMVANYYDDYSFKSMIGSSLYDYKQSEIATLPATAFTRVYGMTTGSKARILGSSNWNWLVTYFDDKLRVIQGIAGNHLGGTDMISNTYNFAGWTLSTRKTHSSSISSYTALEEYSYDAMGRPTTTTHKKGSSPAIVLSKNTINEAGMVSKREIHSTNSGSTFFLENVITKNIRGWTTGMDYKKGGVAALEWDYMYNEPISTPAKRRYDGSISRSDFWHQSGSPWMYTYFYDVMGRMTDANFEKYPATNLLNESLTYDFNGNIKTLDRNTWGSSAVGSDRLVYDYGSNPGNQLKKVTDNASASPALGFNDLNTSGDDYTYDANGNLTSDKNKYITSIAYNVLNMPTRVDFSNGYHILYTYNATGQKLTQDYRNSSGTSLDKRDYIGDIQYINGLIAYAEHPQGRLVPNQNSNMMNNHDAGTTAGFSPYQSTLAVETLSGQTYVSAIYTGSNFTNTLHMSGFRGMRSISNITGNYVSAILPTVTTGQTYLFRVLGYQQTGANAKIFVTDDFNTFISVGTALPIGSSSEGWVDLEVTVPSGVTALYFGVAWEGANTNDKFYVNKVALYNREWEYQYFATDFLGNTRAIFQTQPTSITYRATMETENYSAENSTFRNLNSSYIVTNSAANATSGGDEVIKLNTAYRIGPTKSLRVFQEDYVSLSVSAYFPSAPSMGQVGAGVMATALLNALTGSSQAVVDGVNSAYSQSGLGDPNFTLGSYQGNTHPSAFLNYILFDENYVPVKAKSTPVTNNANVKQTLTINTGTIGKEGYLFVYLSYDNTNTSYDVFFDEFAVTHQEGDFIQINNYYPFGGLSYNWTRDAELENRFYYQGKEFDPTTGLDDFHARQYDPTLGRFMSLDPSSQFASGYTGMGNNPTLAVDPDGNIAWFVPVIIGAVMGAYTGGLAANNGEYNPTKWDYRSGKTWGYMIGGAVIGAASGGMAGQVAASGMPFANTASIAFSSFFNSVGMSTMTGGDVSVSFGVASYNMTDNDWGYLGEKGNSALENIGYGLGALANIQDAVAGVHGTQVDVQSRPKLAGHSETSGTYDGGRIQISVTPGDGGTLGGAHNGLKWEMPYVMETLKGKSINGYNYAIDIITSGDKALGVTGHPKLLTTLNNVNGKWLRTMTDRLNLSKNLLGTGRLKYGLLYGCVNHNARALMYAGVLNINAFLPITPPVLLNAELAIRQAGIYALPFYTTLNNR